MYDNVGNKIKGLATFVSVTGIVISIIICFVMIGITKQTQVPWFFFLGLAIAVVGTFISWVFSLMTVGFAELIIQTTEINRKLKTAGSVPASSGSASAAKGMYGKCSVCGKTDSVTVCKTGNSSSEYQLCSECLQKFRVSPK